MPVNQIPIMKLPKKMHLDPSLYRVPGWIYFFTIVSNSKNSYFTKQNFNNELIECLKKEKERLRCKLYAYCLMPDHLHFLCGTNDEGTSVLDFVDQYKGKSTRIGWRYNINGPLWQRKSYDHILRKEEKIEEVVTYILYNPVRRRLIEKWDDYPFSGFLDNFDL